MLSTAKFIGQSLGAEGLLVREVSTGILYIHSVLSSVMCIQRVKCLLVDEDNHFQGEHPKEIKSI